MTTWKWLKNIIDSKSIYPQYSEDDFHYYIKLIDHQVLIDECMISKNLETDDKEDFENNYKALCNKPLDTAPKTSIGLPKISLYEAEGDSATIVSFNFADKCSWYPNSVPVVGEVLTAEMGNLSFSSNHEFWIDMTHGRLYDEDNIMAANNNKWAIKVYIDDVLQNPELYTVNYELGKIIFETPILGQVKADYEYATTSYFVVRPRTGKRLSIRTAEIQFSKNTIISSPFYFEAWFNNHPTYGTMAISGTRIVYKNAKDFISACNEGQGLIPKWGELNFDVHVFPFKYARPKPMTYSSCVEIRVYILNHEPVQSEYATATFYVVIDPEVV